MSEVIEARLEARDGGRVAWVALRGARTLNLVDGAILSQARSALASLLDDDALRCVVLSGVSPRAFIGGANLNALAALDGDTAEPFIRTIHDFCALLRNARVPVIARMQGYCLGAGLEIAAACDVRVGDSSVRCGMPEVRVGVPSVVEAALLPGLIGWGKARELMLRGNIIEAAEAHAIGLLQQLADGAALDACVSAIVDDVLASGPRAIAAQKRLFLEWEDETTSGAIERGVEALVRAYDSDEPQRAIAAFFAHKQRSSY